MVQNWYINLNANGYQSIFYDIISIVKSLKKSDIILILGVSGCIILPFIRLFRSAKLLQILMELNGKEINGIFL